MDTNTSVCLQLISDNELDMDFHPKILLPFTYIQKVIGKQFRTKLGTAFNYWLQIPDENCQTIVEIVDMLHDASLLIDDIQDNSVLRRGNPVAHSIYGVPSTISAVNYAMSFALEKILKYGHPQALRVVMEQLLQVLRGQGMEIYWRDNLQCPTEEEYKDMAVKKTGSIFILSMRLAQLLSENKYDFTKLCSILGIYFQIRDDYCNLWVEEYTKSKSFCEDLTEGKFSFPIIHAIRNEKGNQVLHILRQRTRDDDVKKYCVSLLERLGSFKYTRNILIELDGELRKEVARLGGNPLLEDLLDSLLSWRQDEKDNHLDATLI